MQQPPRQPEEGRSISVPLPQNPPLSDAADPVGMRENYLSGTSGSVSGPSVNPQLTTRQGAQSEGRLRSEHANGFRIFVGGPGGIPGIWRDAPAKIRHATSRPCGFPWLPPDPWDNRQRLRTHSIEFRRGHLELTFRISPRPRYGQRPERVVGGSYDADGHSRSRLSVAFIVRSLPLFAT